ncbi:MAG: hypothetical protein AB7G93_20845 [Bdellovibrionales bacterium]
MKHGDQTALVKLKRWRDNPVAFVQENFGVQPDDWQAEALNAVAGYGNPRRRLVLKSATGVGKSSVLAWIGWLRLACYGTQA